MKNKLRSLFKYDNSRSLLVVFYGYLFSFWGLAILYGGNLATMNPDGEFKSIGNFEGNILLGICILLCGLHSILSNKLSPLNFMVWLLTIPILMIWGKYKNKKYNLSYFADDKKNDDKIKTMLVEISNLRHNAEIKGYSDRAIDEVIDKYATEINELIDK